MKLGWFLLASFLPENNGQEAAPDLAKLAASFSPEQLAALQRKRVEGIFSDFFLFIIYFLLKNL